MTLVLFRAPFTQPKYLEAVIGNGGERGGRRCNRAFELFHRTEIDILGFSTAGAHHMVMIVFIAKFVAGASAQVHRANQVFLNELF